MATESTAERSSAASPVCIALTGVPGTGKTEVARLLAERLGANLISIVELVKQKKVKASFDKKRKTWAVEIADLEKVVKKELKPGINIVEGHLSHFLIADLVFVLRCDPRILRRRLARRRWPAAKIAENVDAELTDIITGEAMAIQSERRRREQNKITRPQAEQFVYEIDTTNLTAKKTAEILSLLIRNQKSRQKYRPGKINWLASYAKALKLRPT
jgi:adenylate kinase